MIDSRFKFFSIIHRGMKLSVVLIILLAVYVYLCTLHPNLIIPTVLVFTVIKIFDWYKILENIKHNTTYEEWKEFMETHIFKTIMYSKWLFFLSVLLFLIYLSTELFTNEDIVWRMACFALIAFIIVNTVEFYKLTVYLRK